MHELRISNARQWLAIAAAGAAVLSFQRSVRQRRKKQAQPGGSRGIYVGEAVTIRRAVPDVYRVWRRLDELPRFMTHLVSVTTLDRGLSRWVAKGPAGATVEWTARIVDEIENQLIAWQSVDGSAVDTAGSVRLVGDDRGTILRVRLQYDPPAGRAGAAVAWLWGEEPRMQVREDLRRFKQLMETGEIATTEGQPSGRRAAGRFGASRRAARTEAR